MCHEINGMNGNAALVICACKALPGSCRVLPLRSLLHASVAMHMFALHITMVPHLLNIFKCCFSGLWKHSVNDCTLILTSCLASLQVDKLAQEHHIYMTRNGRISMAGVNSQNVKPLAEAIHKVTTQ